MNALVKKILAHPHGFDWSYQGLGMLRLYLSPELRLHVWHPESAVPEVSTLHTHPWHFTSMVVSGIVTNVRYTYGVESDPEGFWWIRQKIQCGEGGGLVGAPARRILVEQPAECYETGMSYSQRAHEIHQSMPEPGAVTIVERDFTSDVDHAFVFWNDGEWVSAEPRPATAAEVECFTRVALSRWTA